MTSKRPISLKRMTDNDLDKLIAFVEENPDLTASELARNFSHKSKMDQNLIFNVFHEVLAMDKTGMLGEQEQFDYQPSIFELLFSLFRQHFTSLDPDRWNDKFEKKFNNTPFKVIENSLKFNQFSSAADTQESIVDAMFLVERFVDHLLEKEEIKACIEELEALVQDRTKTILAIFLISQSCYKLSPIQSLSSLPENVPSVVRQRFLKGLHTELMEKWNISNDTLKDVEKVFTDPLGIEKMTKLNEFITKEIDRFYKEFVDFSKEVHKPMSKTSKTAPTNKKTAQSKLFKKVSVNTDNIDYSKFMKTTYK